MCFAVVQSRAIVTLHFFTETKKQQKQCIICKGHVALPPMVYKVLCWRSTCISYQVHYAQPIPTPKENLRQMSGVTKKNHKKIIYAPILILFGENVVQCLLVSLTIHVTCLRCFCLKGFVIPIVKTKVYRYNVLRSQLVYRIELLQRAGLGAGTK
jgi:hypothetical protein